MNALWLYFLKLFEEMLAAEEPAIQGAVVGEISSVINRVAPTAPSTTAAVSEGTKA